MRFQTPTRFAPFVGFGMFTGVASTSEPAEHDHQDNDDDDGSIDEREEEQLNFDGALSALYPEIGTHLWWTSRFRISGFGRYLITTEGRDADAWYYGVSFAFLR